MISTWVVRLAGIVLIVLGISLVAAAVGVSLLDAHVPLPWWGEGVVGLLLIGAGVYVIGGGSISL